MSTQPLPPSALPDTTDPPLSVVGTLAVPSEPRISPWEKFLKENAKTYTKLLGYHVVNVASNSGAVIATYEFFSLDKIFGYLPPGFQDYDFATNIMVDEVVLLIEPIKQLGSEVRLRLDYWYTSGGFIGNDNSIAAPINYINYEEFYINDSNMYKAFRFPYPMYEVPALNISEDQRSPNSNYSLWPYDKGDVTRVQNATPRLFYKLSIVSPYRKTNLHPDEFDFNIYWSIDPKFSGPHIPEDGGSSLFALSIGESLALGGWSNGINMNCFRRVAS